MSFDTRELRDALGRFATGVCLVSARDREGVAHALTVNSFASVSLDPPLVLWSLQRDSDVYALYSQAQHYAIAVLSDGQGPLSSRYARKGSHVLDPAHWHPGDNDAPLVKEALVNFECSLEQAFDGGDHVILVGRVTRLHPGVEQAPLLFFGGNYRRLG